jgi:hypothetical protein
MPRTAKATRNSTDEAVGIPLFAIEKGRERDPSAYSDAALAIANSVGSGLLKPVDATRNLDFLKTLCRMKTGVDLEDAERGMQDPLVQTSSIFERDEADLIKLKAAIAQVGDARLECKKKEHWLRLIDEVIAIQRECREDSCLCMVYVMRDSEGDCEPERTDSNNEGFFRMEWFHVRFHEIWNDKQNRNSLVMAPPGHAKTTNLRGNRIWRIGKFPHRRILYLADEEDKATSEVMVTYRIVAHPRFRALFPAIRILGRADKEKDTSNSFTVERPNRFSREPTMEGYAIRSAVNGKGYDDIDADDFSPPEVRFQPSVRRDIRVRWNSVISERLRNPRTATFKVICTPWHEDDVACTIEKEVERGRMVGWAVATGNEFGIHDDDNQHPISIWPQKFSSDYYEAKRRTLGNDYPMIYQLRAKTDGNRTITKLEYWNSRPDMNEGLATDNDRRVWQGVQNADRWLSIDPAATANVQSSLQGVIEAVISPAGYAFLTDVFFIRANPVVMMDWIINRIYFAAPPGIKYVHFEGQGAIKGMVSMWIHNIEEALRTGRIPNTDARGNRTIVDAAPVTVMPVFLSTGTNMEQGGGSRQNIGKLKRLKECAGAIQNGIVRFPGYRIAGTDRSRPSRLTFIPGSPMERLHHILTDYDGSNTADAVDALTQWILTNRNIINDPGLPMAAHAAPENIDPMIAAFRKKMDAPSRMERADEPYADEMDFYSGKVA